MLLWFYNFTKGKILKKFVQLLLKHVPNELMFGEIIMTLKPGKSPNLMNLNVKKHVVHKLISCFMFYTFLNSVKRKE